MGIIATALDTAVHIDKDTVYAVKNILNEDFTFSAKGDDNVARDYLIPKGSTLMFPKHLAVLFACEIAKKSVYEKCEDKSKWKGLYKELWIEIAEELISVPGLPVVEEAPKVEEVVVKKEKEEEEVVVEVKKDYEKMSFIEIKREVSARGISSFGKNKEELIKLLS